MRAQSAGGRESHCPWVSQDSEQFLYITPPYRARQPPKGGIGLYVLSDRSMSTTRTSLVSGGLGLALGKRRWCPAAAAQPGAGRGLGAVVHSLEPWKCPCLSHIRSHTNNEKEWRDWVRGVLKEA